MKVIKKFVNKRIDEKFKDIGFKKSAETKYGIQYELNHRLHHRVIYL